MEGPPRSAGKSPNKNEHLGEWDAHVIEQGLENVVIQMFKDFDGRLPDAVIFPETSARPLLYAFKPVLARVCEIKHLKAPHYYFLNTRTPNRIHDVAEKVLEKDIETTEELSVYLDEKEAYERDFDRRMYGDDEFSRRAEESRQWLRNKDREQVAEDPPEKMAEARNIMQQRVREILDYEHKRGNSNPNIAIVDDFVSDLAHTTMELRRAFGPTEVQMYTIFASEHNDAGVQAGVKMGGDRDSWGKERLSFDYRGTSAVGVEKDPLNFSKYTQRIASGDDNPDLGEQKRQLRVEMTTLGDNVASTIIDKLEPIK